MREKHYLEAAARKLQASCPGQARYLLWAYSSSHDAKNTFEETCPYCFQLLVLDNSRVRLKPKPKLTPKIQKLLNREAKSYTLSFKEAKIVKKYKDAKSVLNTYTWTVNTHFLFLKKYEQNKETLFSTKNVAQSARIPKEPKDGLQKFLVFSVKDGF
ncbi:UPF0711 protein C18orf21 homolog isoform X2 [Echinops telfairi]|uniref:UPF0711 protein C18orf21 homolog isoform X2 n=1 Tax=Echinops telfairi TaxID=9371 RepID=A0AC55DKE1_ECHTE|nr:UPF0711 protein C18orf21 homolog isoform X2 [Echinops telfairi]